MTRVIALSLLFITVSAVSAQTEIDTFAITVRGDTARFWAQIPPAYSADHPPALLVWWHQLGGTLYEMRDYSGFDSVAASRGWIAASHFGPNDRHYNAQWAQEHCRAMLDWLTEHYPFSRDSLYMIGGSMGGAAGQVWHNNHCGWDDYLLAATAGGSQILDCQLRQEQYLAEGDTNRSMFNAFGGLPADRDSVAFEYHRNSAIFLADTTQSMHFNSLRLPVWNSWGNVDAERYAYGEPALIWDSLRRAGGAETTLTFQAEGSGHGLGVMWAPGVCEWLSAFSANRFPDELCINADESDTYYWTELTLAQDDTVFGRFGARKDSAQQRIELAFVHNVAEARVPGCFSWIGSDSLRCVVDNLDPHLPTVTVGFGGVPECTGLIVHEGEDVLWVFTSGELIVIVGDDRADFTILFQTGSATGRPSVVPAELRIAQAYPNPFNSVVRLDVESPLALVTRIVLHNVTGQTVLSRSVNLHPGRQIVSLSADGLSSGVYFATLDRSAQRPVRVVLLK